MKGLVWVLACLTLSLPAPWAAEGLPAKLYRWVDKHGKVHYSDTVPAEAAAQERVIYDKAKIRKLEVVEKPKTPEELAREARLAELRQAQQHLFEEQIAHDQALLRTYRNEEELELTLKGQLDTIDARVKVLYANIERQQSQLDSKIREAAELERQGRPVPQALRDAIADLRHQIQQYQSKVTSELQTKEALKTKFAQDLARFNRLQTGFQAHPSPTARPGLDAYPSTLSLAYCQPNTDCPKAWQLARRYVQSHATTPLFIDSEALLYTEDPHQDQDIALAVARIHGQTQDTLFLDVRCKLSGIGKALCQSERVQDILAGFARFIQEGLQSTAQ